MEVKPMKLIDFPNMESYFNSIPKIRDYYRNYLELDEQLTIAFDPIVKANFKEALINSNSEDFYQKTKIEIKEYENEFKENFINDNLGSISNFLKFIIETTKKKGAAKCKKKKSAADAK